MATNSAPETRLRPPLKLQSLVPKSVVNEALEHNRKSVREVKTPLGNTAHVVAATDVLYVPRLGLQIIDDRFVPTEGIVDPWYLGYLQCRDRSGRIEFETAADADSRLKHIDEQVCILSNVFSYVFSHFIEELLKVLILERAGYSGPYVYTKLPKFAFEFWEALELDRRRLIAFGHEPLVFRSALYTTNLSLRDLGKCPDVFFELRDRMASAAAGFSSRFGKRLWLDRRANVTDPERDLVNSEEVERHLNRYGFLRLDMGNLPLLEQVAAARQADVIAGPHGSAMLHCMHMKPRSKVIEIFSPKYLNGYCFEICRLLRHQHVMVAGDNTPFAPYRHGKRVHVPCNQLAMAFENL